MRESGAQIACRWGWGGDFCSKAHTTGEVARRYLVKIKGRETCLYESSGRWFVEMKA